MKIPRSRKVLAGVGAGVLVLGVGTGAAVAGVGQDDGNDDDAPVSRADADRAREAAVADAGGGTANEVDREDDGDAAWEVEVVRDDGTSVDVHLDADFGVVSASDSDSDDADDSDEGDADDAPFSAEEADRAATAAVDEVGAGSTANGVDREDDGDAAWEVEVLREDGSTVDVRLDADFAVVAVEEDTPAG